MKLTHQYKTFASLNIIIDLSQYDNLAINEIKQSLLSKAAQRKLKKSFVIVVPNVDYNAIPDQLTVVPSLLEA
jgi:hypothetical protein